MGGNFPADSVIGVSLPWLGTQNWKESETELDAQLKAAGFTPMIQKEFTQAATQDWDNAKAQARMDSILSGFYSDKDIHGVLSPNDAIGCAIITSAKAAGQDIPIVTGLDAENESLVSIWNDSSTQPSRSHRLTLLHAPLS